MNWPIRNPSGDWSQWLPDGELQINGVSGGNGHEFDEDDCLSFKRVHAVETAVYQMTGLKIKYSVRYLAYWAKTVENVGAYESNVDAAMSQYGLALESDWPLIDDGVWADWDAEPQAEVVAKAQQFNRSWNFQSIPINAEDVPVALKTAPVEVILTISGSEHPGEMIYAPGTPWPLFNSYEPFQTTLSPDEVINFYYLPLLTPMPNNYVQVMNYNGTVGIFVPLDSEDPKEIGLFNNLFNIQIAPNTDGTIPVQKTVVDK